MAAIVTEQFRRNSAQSLLADIADSTTNFYVGLGKSDSWVEDEQLTNWTVPDPDGTNGEALEIKSNLITLLKAETANCALTIPRVNWKVGQRHKAYTPYDENCFYPETINNIQYLPCYAVNVVGSNIAVYLCLKTANTETASTPNDITSYAPRTYGSDGYVWALIDVISIVEASINTDQYISINSGSVSNAAATNIANSSGGTLYGFTVLNGGSGYEPANINVTFTPYTSTTTLAAITCAATVSNGQLVDVILPTGYSYTTGIVNGTFSITGVGTGAAIAANITPAVGLAHTPSRVLPSWFVGVSVDAVDNISSDGFYIPYRQISILKGVTHNQSGSPATLGALKYLKLVSALPALLSIETGTLITFNNGSRALFDEYASVTVEGTVEYRVYYHQNTKSGYGKIENTGTVNIATNTGIAYSTISNNEYVPNSGDVIFIENRKPIVRAQSQTEEIKIIIQL
jgi:hypothetical protein